MDSKKLSPSSPRRRAMSVTSVSPSFHSFVDSTGIYLSFVILCFATLMSYFSGKAEDPAFYSVEERRAEKLSSDEKSPKQYFSSDEPSLSLSRSPSKHYNETTQTNNLFQTPPLQDRRSPASFLHTTEEPGSPSREKPKPRTTLSFMEYVKDEVIHN